MFFRLGFQGALGLFCAIFLMSADQHLQTSVDPSNNRLIINVLGDEIQVNLDLPGVRIEKDERGELKTIFFHQVNHHYQIFFHSGKRFGLEQVAVIKQFRIFDDRLVLDGRCQSFSESGQLLSSSHWSRGVLHGKQRIFNETGQLIEERNYSQGFPIGTWSHYSASGYLLVKTVFPDDLQTWMNTESLPAHSERGLRGEPFYRPITVIEQWYRSDGSVQQEKHYRVHKKGDSFVVVDPGYRAMYDAVGQLTQESRKNAFSEKRTLFLLNQGQKIKETTTWIDGKKISRSVTAAITAKSREFRGLETIWRPN